MVGHNENIELEAQLAEVKAELRARKEEVRVMTEEMEKKGRDLAARKYLSRGTVAITRRMLIERVDQGTRTSSSR